MKKNILIAMFFMCSFLHAEKPEDAFTNQVCAVLPSLQGWCSKEKALNFIDLVLEVRPKVCVEIGVFGGSSLYPVASALKFLGEGVVIGIDPWDRLECIKHLTMKEDVKHLDWWGKVPIDTVYQSYQGMLRRFGLEKQVKTIKKTAEKAAPEIKEIDILYMDAIYSEKMADDIVRLYLPKVRSGGYVWINDALGEKTHAACDFLLESCEFVKDIDGGNCLLFRKR